MALVKHRDADVFISKNSNLPIARVIARAAGAVATELWEQPLRPGDVIPMHYHLIEETVTFHRGQISVSLDGELLEVDADADGPVSVLIPALAHHEIRNIGAAPTSMLAFFPALDPEIFPVRA